VAVIGRELGGGFSLPASVRSRLTPKPRLPVSQWAIRKPFWITEKGAAYPGPYDLTLTPYMREPLDAMGMPGVRRMNWAFCPQSGKTKGAEVGMTWLLEHRPSNWIYIRPAEPDIDEAFRDRFVPMIKANLPHLVPGASWVTLSKNHRIELVNQILYGAAVTIARQFTSRTAAKIYYDETDTGDVSGNSLGDALESSADRQMMVGEDASLTLGTSSVKYESGANWQAYEDQSDRRAYWEPCPECGRYQELPAEEGAFDERFVTVRRWRDPDEILAERLARFVCEHCGSMIADEWQGWMSDRGVWVPRGQSIEAALPLDDAELVARARTWLPDAATREVLLEYLPKEQHRSIPAERWEPELVGSAPDGRHRGYRIWAANVKAEQRSWSHMLREWFKATATKDPTKIQVVVNSWKSLPWKESLKAADEELAAKRIGEHPPGEVPSRAKVVLGAIDIQEGEGGYLSYDFWAFGKVRGGELAIWQIETGRRDVQGEDYLAALRGLWRDKAAGWPVRGRGGWMMRPYAVAVDSGAVTGDAYEFSREPGVVAVKGVDDARDVVRHSELEGKLSPEPIDLFTLNGKVFGSRLYRLIVEPVEHGEGGGLWFHADTTKDYLREITAEELKVKKGSKKKVATWQKKSEARRNEAWDKGRYILALADILERLGELSVTAMTVEDDPVGVFVNGEPMVPSRGEDSRLGDDDEAGGLPPMEIPEFGA
jgi:phage terminase large subunit GpA-like protein